ncbi:MAG: hypothetical protein LBR25_08105 [Erysipelotrichaceae bacterium]|jgi:hypothetical protein|nr:hypothetical protein [Erysipelotrichaceae bacterium]
MVSRKGFTLLEALTALLVSGFVCLLLADLANCMSRHIDYDSKSQDLLSVWQLRLVLNSSDYVEVGASQVRYFRCEKVYVLRFVNRKVASMPGDVIYFMDVDEVYFNEEDGFLVIHLWRQHQETIYRIRL